MTMLKRSLREAGFDAGIGYCRGNNADVLWQLFINLTISCMDVMMTIRRTCFTYIPSLALCLLLATPITALAAESQHLNALQSGPVSDINTFGVIPQDGDTLDAGKFTVTIDQPFAAGVVDALAGSVVLSGEFIVEAGIILTVNGDWDASQANTQNQLKTGAVIEFDGPSGVNRSYKATERYYGEPSLVVQSDAQDKAFFGLKIGSSATFAYDKQGFLGSNISGGNVHLNGFSTGYIHDGYESVNTRDCNMPNVLFTNSAVFQLRYFAADAGSCDLKNLTILSATSTTAFISGGGVEYTTQGSAFNLNGLSVDGGVEYYMRPEFLMNDWVVRDLAATKPLIGWQNLNSWLLFNANAIPIGAAETSNIYFRNEKYNPHGFLANGGGTPKVKTITFDNVVFDFINLDDSESGDFYGFNRAGTENETIHIRNNIGLRNLNGKQSSTFITFNGEDQNGRKLELENNVMFVPLDNRSISLNESSLTPADTLTSIKKNIFWGQVDGKGYVVDSLGSSSETDILSSGAYSNNGTFNVRTDGSHGELDLPLSYTPDRPATTADPRFNDADRRLETYGRDVLMLDGTAESAFKAFVTRHLSVTDLNRLELMAAHDSYVSNHKGPLAIKDMIDWIKQGFVPTTTTYHGADQIAAIGLDVIPTFTLTDTDGDTVDDRFDSCEATPADDSIDENGCGVSQKDDDNDGIANVLDICNDTRVPDVDEQGCSIAQIGGEIVGFKSWGIGGGGAMAGYSINPFDPKMQFVGTDMGTAFRSIDSGVNWAPINHSQTTYSNILGYATSFGFASSTTVLHAPQGLDPVISIDGGQTFTAVAYFGLSAQSERIRGWYSDTENEGTIYAMTNLGLWRSADAGNNWQFVYDGGEIKGMFIDSFDGGKVYIATQERILLATDGKTFRTYFTPGFHKIHRFSGGSNATTRTLTYASDASFSAIFRAKQSGLATGDVKARYTLPNDAGEEVSAGMIYVKINKGGFKQTSQFVGSHLKMAQNDPLTIYATGSRNWGRDKGTSVYVSKNAGDTWKLKLLQYDWDADYSAWDGKNMEHSPVGLNAGWYDGGYYTVAINQLNSAQFGGSGNFFLYSTNDSGAHWLDLTNNYQGTVPTNPNKADTWSTSGLNVTSVYDIKFNPANSNDIYAAYADIHGARSTDGGQNWQILPSSENSIYDFAFDPTDENIIYMANGSQHDFPLLSLSIVGDGGIFKSTNKGDSWQKITPNTADYNRQYLSVGFDATRKHIYAGSHSDGISRSTDGGTTWQKFNRGLPSEYLKTGFALDVVVPQIEVLANGNVYALVTGVRPQFTATQVETLDIPQNKLIPDTSNGITTYYGWINSDETGIYWLDVVNGATEWQLLRSNINTASHGNWDAEHQPWRRPMSFAIDPNNSNVLWMTDIDDRTFQLKATGLWKSTDHGQNWHYVLQHTLPLAIKIDPNDSNHIVVAGHEIINNGGVYVSKDGGENWLKDSRSPLQNNANAVSFDPKNSDKIIYGYFGGGMLSGDKL
ncbi:MAG: hypothetical protein ACI8WB_004181 [Phenylobacterium sp.]|jgi:hypothetical protein